MEGAASTPLTEPTESLRILSGVVWPGTFSADGVEAEFVFRRDM